MSDSAKRLAGRLLQGLRVWIDENRREWEGRRTGWNVYVENVYMHYFELREGRRPASRRRHWQDYMKKPPGEGQR